MDTSDKTELPMLTGRTFPDFPPHIQTAANLQRYSQHTWANESRECLHQAFIIEGEDARQRLVNGWQEVYENPLIVNTTKKSLDVSQSPENEDIDGVLINGFHKLKQTHLSTLHSILQTQTSVNPDMPTLPSETPVAYVCTPPGGGFDEYEQVPPQIPVSIDVWQQFDFVWPIPSEDIDNEVARSAFIKEKLKGDDRRSVDSVAAQTIRSQQIDTVSESAETALNEFHWEANDGIIGDGFTNLSNEYDTVLSGDVASKPACKIAAARAVSVGEDNVTEQHVRLGVELTRRYLYAIGFVVVVGQFDIEKIESGHVQRTRDLRQSVKSTTAELCERARNRGDEPFAHIDDIVQQVDEDDVERIEHAVTDLCQRAELYEPETDYYAVV